jgi:hypothetical protein
MKNTMSNITRKLRKRVKRIKRSRKGGVMSPPKVKFTVSGTTSALKKRSKLLRQSMKTHKPFKPTLYQRYFNRFVSMGMKPQEAKKNVLAIKTRIKNSKSKTKTKPVFGK